MQGTKIGNMEKEHNWLSCVGFVVHLEDMCVAESTHSIHDTARTMGAVLDERHKPLRQHWRVVQLQAGQDEHTSMPTQARVTESKPFQRYAGK